MGGGRLAGAADESETRSDISHQSFSAGMARRFIVVFLWRGKRYILKFFVCLLLLVYENINWQICKLDQFISAPYSVFLPQSREMQTFLFYNFVSPLNCHLKQKRQISRSRLEEAETRPGIRYTWNALPQDCCSSRSPLLARLLYNRGRPAPLDCSDRGEHIASSAPPLALYPPLFPSLMYIS